MPTTIMGVFPLPRDPVRMVAGALELWAKLLGPGLYGLACSGGADSIALVDAAITAFGAHNVIVLHVDHGLSPASASVAAEVAAWARGRGVVAIVRRVEVARRASVEAAARDARYAALDAIAEEVGISRILLAHTARDQAETVMMRIVRGTGPAGLGGMRALRGRYVRPLLEVPRSAIERYVAARQLPTWHDPMNDDLSLARVRMRNKLLPALRAENPAIDEALCRLAASAREWTTVIDELAEHVSAFPIDCSALRTLDPAVRKYAYASALEASGFGYDASHLDQIDAIAARPSEGELAVSIPGGRVVRSYDSLDVIRTPPPAPRRSPALPADVRPATIVRPSGVYEVRVWRPGDRMKPARLKGRTRKLSDLYIDAKVPRSLRPAARVVIRVHDQVIVWAEHIGLAHGESADIVPVPDRTAGTF